MIQARIEKTFPARVDSVPFHLSIEFEAGPGITVVFGPSGSGKSLTLDCVAGFAEPDSGRILIDDAIVFDSGARVSLPPQERQCGYVFQKNALFPHMTVRDNLLFGIPRLPSLERTRRVSDMLTKFELDGVGGRRPHEISGGQKQRCAIARALIAQPRVLLLDEPAQGLDAPLRSSFYEVLRQVRSNFQTPVILVTHSLEECLELGDRMLVLETGRVVQAGTPSEVLARPASLAVAGLFANFNIFEAEIVALDPSRNTSLLRLPDGSEVQNDYYPGHLKGDHVRLLATRRQLDAFPAENRHPSLNQLPVRLLRTVDLADAIRLEFHGDFTVEIPRGDIDRNNEDWLIEFPKRGLRVI